MLERAVAALRLAPDDSVVDATFGAGGYSRAFLAAGVWGSMRHHLVVMLREGAGREAGPTAAVIDTQSVKTTERGDPAAGTRRSG